MSYRLDESAKRAAAARRRLAEADLPKDYDHHDSYLVRTHDAGHAHIKGHPGVAHMGKQADGTHHHLVDGEHMLSVTHKLRSAGHHHDVHDSEGERKDVHGKMPPHVD